jgi:hypothetical protein
MRRSIRQTTNRQPTARRDEKRSRLTQERDKQWFVDHNREAYWKESEHKVVWENGWKQPEGWEKVKALCEDSQKQNENGGKIEPNKDMTLPSWVPRASNAPFEIYRHPGMMIKKTGRANADPLVGLPQDGHRNYSAAQTETLKLDCLRFKKRPYMGHYSLFVPGFVVGMVADVRDAAQGGCIPRSWLEFSGWEPPYNKDPPAEFWRTIVADRGANNRNPPYYYARACRESVDRGGLQSGRVNTTALIYNERNSIIAEFCRRVQAVIWNRSLFKTDKGKLGLGKNVQKGDLICVLYGCTVPVILSRRSKDPGERESEELEDQYEAFKLCFQRLESILVRKKRYEELKKKYRKEDELLLVGTEHEEQEEWHDAPENSPEEEQEDWQEADEETDEAEQEEQPEAQELRDEQQQDRVSRWAALKGLLMPWSQGRADADMSEVGHDEQEVRHATQAQMEQEGIQEQEETTSQQAMHEQSDTPSAQPYISSKWEQDVKSAQVKVNKILQGDRKARNDQQKNDKQRKEILKPPAKDGGEERAPKPRFKLDEETFYVFKGEAYVHGCMDGEAVRERFYGTEQEQIFELR